jgi:hypothetical protein
MNPVFCGKCLISNKEKMQHSWSFGAIVIRKNNSQKNRVDI